MARARMAPRWAVTALAGGAVGWIAWSGSLCGLLAAPALALIWRRGASRAAAFAAAFAYYLAAGRGVVHGAGVFFGDAGAGFSLAAGLALWCGYSAVLAAVWAALWGARRRGWRMLAIVCVLSLPPVGIVGGFHPLLAAGAYFPGLGWPGLVLACAGLCAIAAGGRIRSALSCLAIAVVANVLFIDPVAAGWTPVHTALGEAKDTGAQYDRMMALQQLVLAASRAADPGTVFVLPELVGGDWSLNEHPWNDVRLRLRGRHQTALLGVYIPDEAAGDGGLFYENAIVAVGHERDKTMAGRMPVPIAMWQPWAGRGAKAHWTDAGVTTIAGRRMAALICYEQLLVWPALLNFAARPEILIGPANDWWARDTSIPSLQRLAFRSWGRLFGVPAIWAGNF